MSIVGCSFAGLFLTSDVLPDESLTGPTNSCFTFVTTSLYSMENIYSAEKNGIEFSYSQCDAFDECLSNPCDDRNKCLNKYNEYECVCYGGYSGVHCEIPPDFCSDNKCYNGGTCMSNFFNYTCTCSSNYTGAQCETSIVHGNWGHWLEWSQCSRSCGGGKQTRVRFCNDPSPDPFGLTCVGSNISEQICNFESCPGTSTCVKSRQLCTFVSIQDAQRGVVMRNVCNCRDVIQLVVPTLKFCPHKDTIYQYKNEFNCSTIGDSQSCIVTCQPGHVFAKDFQPLDRYECGPHTAYKWNAKPPPCANVRSPRGVAVATTIKYTTDCNNQDKMQSVLLQNLNDLQCIQNKTCSVKTKMSDCLSSNRNRRFTTTVDASIQLNSDLSGDYDLHLEDFYTHKIVSPALLQLVNVYVDVASSINQMNTTDILTLNVSGSIYEADTSTLNVNTTLMCPDGTFEEDLACTECPVGTFWRNNLCEMCPRKTYQDFTGQLQCKQCPDGFTTLYIASRNISDCSVRLETEISSIVPSVEKTEVTSEPVKGDDFVLLVLVPISVVVVVSGIIVSVLLIYRNIRKRQLNTRGSTVSLNDAVSSAYKAVQEDVNETSDDEL